MTVAGEGHEVLAGITVEESDDRSQEELDALRTWHSELTDGLAALMVRRMCNQHGCAGPGCDHPDHVRDVDYLRHCLAVLGLPGKLPMLTEEDYARHLTAFSNDTRPRHTVGKDGKTRQSRNDGRNAP